MANGHDSASLVGVGCFRRSQALQSKAHKLIPGGAHTYAKGEDQYPEQAPAFIAYGQGCHVWDLDGNEFIEYGMGLRAVTLGHGFEPVVQAAYEQMRLGVNFTRPTKIEVDAAEALLELIDGAEMVKFAKNGSDVTTAAVVTSEPFFANLIMSALGRMLRKSSAHSTSMVAGRVKFAPRCIPR